MQNHLNLICREEEREVLPLYKEEKNRGYAYSPLVGGRLAREATTHRTGTDQVAKQKYDATADADQLW